MGDNLNLLTAAAAGVVSFLSPCVLPLIPGYISFVSGISLGDLKEEGVSRQRSLRPFLSSLWFVLGFTVVFVALGASATALGQLFLQKLALLQKAAGGVIVLFGLHLIGVLRIPFLQAEKKLEVRRRPLTGLGAFLVGAAFAFGWTPCIGPILAGILALASTQETLRQGMGLLTAYSLGLGVPFLLTSLGIQRFLKLFARFRRYLRAVEVASGLLLVAIGLLIFTDRLTALSQVLTFFNRFAL
ncbi:MAG: cytochrome c biogenesis protein CcdA [Candidatus Omnitrophica bacterium]|nr:cytochrome c biogenesis protein CcdA [Candidatus Omnitrophota bacterium]